MYPKGTPFSEGFVVSPNDLLSAPEEVLVVNPGSLSFGLSKKMIVQMFRIFDEEFGDENN